MRRFVTTIMLCVGCLMAANAQTFTERLKKKTAGEGTVTVTQSQVIDDLVNGTIAEKENDAKTATGTSTAATPARTTPRNEAKSDTVSSDPVVTGKKVMRGGYKVWGYRIQVYAGGNQRKDRQRAEHTGSEIKAMFPNQPVYVHFYSPRWICRMGNFRTYEEAHSILTSIRKQGYTSATIIKDKITVHH